MLLGGGMPRVFLPVCPGVRDAAIILSWGQANRKEGLVSTCHKPYDALPLQPF